MLEWGNEETKDRGASLRSCSVSLLKGHVRADGLRGFSLRFKQGKILTLSRMKDTFRVTYKRKSAAPLKWKKSFPSPRIGGLVLCQGQPEVVDERTIGNGQWEIKDKWNLKILEVEQVRYGLRSTSKPRK